MLSYLTLKNFKCFEEQSFALGNLTIVAGANGAGKSTLIQALMLLRQSDLDKRTMLSEKVQLRGGLVNLKSADAIRYFGSEDADVTISIEDDTIADVLNVTIVDAVKDEDPCKTSVFGNLSEFESCCALFSKDKKDTINMLLNSEKNISDLLFFFQYLSPNTSSNLSLKINKKQSDKILSLMLSNWKEKEYKFEAKIPNELKIYIK